MSNEIIYSPTIDTVVSPANNTTQIITGTKRAGQYIYIRNNSTAWVQVSYPDGVSGLSWNYTMPLVGGKNIIEVVSSPASNTTNISSIVNATIYMNLVVPEVFNSWNSLDEFGVTLGLARIKGETNTSYKARLLDVYTNKADSTRSGIINGIARELGVDSSLVTINTFYELMDPNSAENILNTDGNAINTKLEDYADEVYKHSPMFFGDIIADESYWDMTDEDGTGYSYLPHTWDPVASGIYGKWQMSGIGDQDDLHVNDVISRTISGEDTDRWYARIHSGYFYTADPSGVTD